MKITSAYLCEEKDMTDGKLVDRGITSVTASSYPTPLRKSLVLIVVIEAADLDRDLRIRVGVKTGDVTTFGSLIDLTDLAYSARSTDMPAWHVAIVRKDQLQLPSDGYHSVVFVNDGIELFKMRLWAKLDLLAEAAAGLKL
jgi:hypothetical protein